MYCNLKANTKTGVIRTIISKLQIRLNNNIDDEKQEFFKQIHFLFCESCFWCASYLNPNTISISKCPSCYNNKIRLMRIPSVNIANHIKSHKAF